jgi:hypothetical protein
MATQTRKHGIVIIHGVGRHQELEVLTDFAAGLLETMEAQACKVCEGKDAQSPSALDCRADLDMRHGDNYVEISWPDGSALFRIQEAYWQKAYRPQPPLRVWRWLWQTIAGLMGWANKWRLRFLGVGVLLLHIGQAFLGLMALRTILGWLGRIFTLPPAFIGLAPAWLRRAAEFLFPAQYPLWARLLAGLPVAFLALAVAVLAVSIREMWQKEPKPPGWTRRIPWPVGIVLVGVASWVYVILQLEALVRRFPLGFPGRDALANLLGRISEFFQQDAVGDAGVYAFDVLRAASVRRELEHQVHRLCDAGYEDIHIVGHSLGSIVTFEVLARTLPEEYRKSVKTFFSVGSPLQKFLFLLDEPQAVDEVRRRIGADRSTNEVSRLGGALGKLWDALASRLLGPRGPRPAHRLKALRIKDKGIAWHNIVADWDLFPDMLAEAGLGKVTDVPVISTRKLGAHSGYWDADCETMQYILEQIEPDVFGTDLHDEILGAPVEGQERGGGKQPRKSRKAEISSWVAQWSA